MEALKSFKSYAGWTLVIFIIAWLFYFLTGASVPYPGRSSDYLAGILFPGQWPLTQSYPLDSVVWRLIANCCPREYFMVVARVFCSFLGALAIVAVFRSAISGVRLSTADLFSFSRKEDQELAVADIRATATLVSVGTALMVLMVLPMWASATRPLSGSISVMLTILLFGLSLSVRWRSMLSVIQMELPTRQAIIRMALVFFLAVYLCTMALSLAPVILLCLVEAGRVFLRKDAENRLSYLPGILIGCVLGILLSMLTIRLWNKFFVPSTGPDDGIVMQWVMWVTTAWKIPYAFFHTFPGLSALLLVACAAILNIGCFPIAYIHFASPLVGQLTILGLMGCGLALWPSELWETMAEPTPLMTLGWVLMTISFGLLVGSWIKVWLDSHLSASRRTAYSVAACVVLVISVAFAWVQFKCHAAEGSALPANKASITQAWIDEKDAPKQEPVWLKADPILAEFFVTSWVNDVPIVPVLSLTKALPLLPQLQKTVQGDPLLSLLATIGDAHFEYYLRERPELLLIETGTFPLVRLVEMIRAREMFERSDFAKTSLGKRVGRGLCFEISKMEAIRALSQDRESALLTLRAARVISPENEGVLLSLEAMGELYGEEARQALMIRENTSWMRAPTWEKLAAFEAEYGPVRSPTFIEGARFARLLNVFQEEWHPSLVAAYLRCPEKLADYERVIALLSLSADEAFKVAQRPDVSVDELTYILCTFPSDPRSAPLFEQNREKLEARDALSLLFNKRNYLSEHQVTERIRSFFSRDSHFPYARYVVEAYLNKNKNAEALDFVQNLVVNERLRATPWLMEFLRLRVIRVLLQEDPVQAESILHSWLEGNPNQPVLWTELLNRPSVTWDELCACLRVYPLHRKAMELVEQRIRETIGEEAAQDYREHMEKARAKAGQGKFVYENL